MSLSLYKKIEGCERRPQSDFAKRCDELYGTPAVFALLREAVLAEPYPEWFGPRVLHEDKATVIHEWEQRGVPGLLQTEAYARTIIRACRPYVAPDVIERDVRARLERQDILTRDNSPRLWVVVAEGVLRQNVGGANVMREQLDHLIAASESQRAVLQVLAFGAADAPGADGPAAMFEFEDSRLP